MELWEYKLFPWGEETKRIYSRYRTREPSTVPYPPQHSSAEVDKIHTELLVDKGISCEANQFFTPAGLLTGLGGWAHAICSYEFGENPIMMLRCPAGIVRGQWGTAAFMKSLNICSKTCTTPIDAQFHKGRPLVFGFYRLRSSCTAVTSPFCCSLKSD